MILTYLKYLTTLSQSRPVDGEGRQGRHDMFHVLGTKVSAPVAAEREIIGK